MQAPQKKNLVCRKAKSGSSVYIAKKMELFAAMESQPVCLCDFAFGGAAPAGDGWKAETDTLYRVSHFSAQLYRSCLTNGVRFFCSKTVFYTESVGLRI